MPTNDSASGGPLLPDPLPAPQPLEDQDLEDFFQKLVADISGVAPTLVFPRWQPEPPNIPPFDTDWAAVGITETDPDTYAAVIHHCDNPDGPGHDELQRHEDITILASFYGPHARGNADRLKDGWQIAQNREPLWLAGMGFVATGRPVTVPEQIKDIWLMRVDIPIVIRRAIQRTYPVRNLQSATGTITSSNPALAPSFNVNR